MDEEKHPHALEPAEQPLPVPVPEADDATREKTTSPSEKDRSHGHTKEDDNLEAQRPTLYPVRSHISTHDAAVLHDTNLTEPGDEIYARFPPRQKLLIVSILSFCSFLAPISSTSILAASPEVVATYNTTGAIFNVSNAMYLIFMGISPLFWGPMGMTFGRKWTMSASAVAFTAFSAGSAAAPNLASYFVFRCLTAFQGTSFLIVGSM